MSLLSDELNSRIVTVLGRQPAVYRITSMNSTETDDVIELRRQVAMLKEQLRVCEGSYEFYRSRCQLLETANENANAMIEDISDEYARFVARTK